MSGEVEVSPAREDELDAVLELWAASRSAHARTADDHEVLARLRACNPESLLVARLDGRVVGTLIAAWDGWRGNMYRLAVADKHRRQGIAQALVEEGHSLLRAKGARRITALVAHPDEPAIALWQAAGYERDELIVRFVRNL